MANPTSTYFAMFVLCFASALLLLAAWLYTWNRLRWARHWARSLSWRTKEWHALTTKEWHALTRCYRRLFHQTQERAVRFHRRAQAAEGRIAKTERTLARERAEWAETRKAFTRLLSARDETARSREQALREDVARLQEALDFVSRSLGMRLAEMGDVEMLVSGIREIDAYIQEHLKRRRTPRGMPEGCASIAATISLDTSNGSGTGYVKLNPNIEKAPQPQRRLKGI